jgi:hypothetical protein
MKSACAALYFHLWHVRLYQITPHYFTKKTIFGNETYWTQNVHLDFPYKFIHKIYHSRNNWAPYGYKRSASKRKEYWRDLKEKKFCWKYMYQWKKTNYGDLDILLPVHLSIVYLYFQLDTLFSSVYIQCLGFLFHLHVSDLTGPSSGGLNCTCCQWYPLSENGIFYCHYFKILSIVSSFI